MIDLDALKKADAAWKSSDYTDDVSSLVAYYDDASSDLTRQRLTELGVGLKANRRPLEVSLLRRVIDRIAVVYDRPATRWLLKPSGERFAEDSGEHRLMTEILDRAQYDLAWRRVDRRRALVRMCAVRFYPSDARRSVVLRTFDPSQILRSPSTHAPDCIDEDNRFALKLAGGAWEAWERTSDGWICFWLDEKGAPLESQPFGAAGAAPYPELPVQLIYDDWPDGRPWLPVRCSRLSWVEAINAISNDLWALIVTQAHSQRVLKSSNPTATWPSEAGPSTVVRIDADEDVEDLSANPRIAECQAVLESLTRLWMISEDLPASELDRSKQVVTGATLRVQEQPLLQRREAQIPLAREDERIAWRRLRAVHNFHAPDWGVPILNPTTELDVELADVEIPVDAREAQETIARSMALGSASVIDLIQAEHRVPRHQAIRIYERIQADREAYPIKGEPASQVAGQKPADVEAPENGADNGADAAPSLSDLARDGADSVTDAAAN